MRGALVESMGSNHSVSHPEINANRWSNKWEGRQCLHFGTDKSVAALRPLSLSQDRQYGIDNFLGADGFHAAEIDRTLAQEAGTALNLMSQNDMTVAQRSGQSRFR